MDKSFDVQFNVKIFIQLGTLLPFLLYLQYNQKLINMTTRIARHSLMNQIQGLETPKKQPIIKIDYQLLINRQQQLIGKLHQQIKYLRQYIQYFANEQQNLSQKQLQTDTSYKCQQQSHNNQKLAKQSPKSKQNLNTKQHTYSPSISKKTNQLKQLIKQIMKMIEVQDVDHVREKLQNIINKANHKIQPIFIQRIKYKQVPIPMQIIKQVQKQVIVYKQRIVQLPIFKQKIVQRYITKPPQPEQNNNINIQNKSMNNSQNTEQIKESQKKQDQYNLMKKKLNFIEPLPKMNQTLNIKSPRYKQKDNQQGKDKWSSNNLNGTRSPRYRQKDGY